MDFSVLNDSNLTRREYNSGNEKTNPQGESKSTKIKLEINVKRGILVRP